MCKIRCKALQWHHVTSRYFFKISANCTSVAALSMRRRGSSSITIGTCMGIEVFYLNSLDKTSEAGTSTKEHLAPIPPDLQCAFSGAWVFSGSWHLFKFAFRWKNQQYSPRRAWTILPGQHLDFNCVAKSQAKFYVLLRCIGFPLQGWFCTYVHLCDTHTHSFHLRAIVSNKLNGT